ncbi:MAG: type 3 dihydrofolate reductase [Candidatus Dasytiphilus stammeri]
MISLIVAIASNHVIGNNNTIPWYLPIDRAWFKKHTLYKPVIMGRYTWESINQKPLPERVNIIISNVNNSYYYKSSNNVIWVNSINKAISFADSLNLAEIMVIGGASIYSQMLDYAHCLYITSIDLNIEGNAYFPKIDSKKWVCTFREFHEADKMNTHNCYFNIFKLRK